MIRRNYFPFVLMFLFLFCIPFASALLVSPAKIELSSYAAGGTEEFDITVMNDISEDIVIEMSYESWEGKIDYIEYFQAVGYENNKIEIPAGESRTVHFIMTYPELEQFGHVRFATIRFYQVPVFQGNTIAATVAVRIPLEVDVPYPEKYVKIEVQDPGVVLPTGNAELQAVLTNLGQNVLESVEGDFLLVQDGEEKYSFSFEPLSLFLQGESKTVSSSFDTASLEAGRYDVFARVSYDGETRTSSSQTFIIGEKVVEILGISSDSFSAGSSNTVTVSLLNHWIESVDTDLSLDLLTSDGELLGSSSLGFYTLPVGEEKAISYGFDFSPYDVGVYTLRVRSSLDGMETTKNFPITLISTDALQGAPGTGMFSYALILIVLVLLLFFVVGYLIYRKRLENLS